MSMLTDRASYLKGLAEGMNLNTEKNSNRLINELVQLTSEMAAEIEALSHRIEELNDFVEVIDSDLSEIEEIVENKYPAEDDEEDEDEDVDNEAEMEDGEDAPAFMISRFCPACGKEIQLNIDELDFEKEIPCPACGENLFPEEEMEESAEAEETEEDAEETEEIDNPEE